ncbi:coiled-coil domain-containing protein 113 [Ooceraea biroi]|uniref:coiled-coil domain-containing protein 113 n=1 Tax=Ooceraea biroi TaxID=2015173 RepID=UPI0009716B9E|nr:coiled-coil domain-containing protein 113 [Ooceraea biroi]
MSRFIEEWLKVLDIIMERIRLKIITLKSQIQKVNLQLKHRKEFGEALRAIDFEQLNIENQDCIRRIEEKNQYLLEMKRITGRYSIALTKHKEKLGGLISTVNEVRNKIASKNKKITKLQSDQTMMQIEIEKMEEQHKSITELMNNFHVIFLDFYVQLISRTLFRLLRQNFFKQNLLFLFLKIIKGFKRRRNVHIHTYNYLLLNVIYKNCQMQVPRVIDFVKMRAELHELRRIHKQLTRQRKIQQITLKLNRH